MQDFYRLEGSPLSAEFSSRNPGPAKQKASLIFVDPSARDISRLILEADRNADLVFLSAMRDGPDQILRYLAGRGRLSLIHLLADFTHGRLTLGNKHLVVRSLRDYPAVFARIGRAVSGGGEILIGSGAPRDGQGDTFRHALATLAGAPVRLWDGGSRG
jgi:hypothetical protein